MNASRLVTILLELRSSIMRTPPKDTDYKYLIRWLPPEESARKEYLDDPMEKMMMAGYVRNILRHAESWGPALICALIESGYLEKEGDPLEALTMLMDDHI